MLGNDNASFVSVKLSSDFVIGPANIGLNSGISKQQNHTNVATKSRSTKIKSNFVWRLLKKPAYRKCGVIILLDTLLFIIYQSENQTS